MVFAVLIIVPHVYMEIALFVVRAILYLKGFAVLIIVQFVILENVLDATLDFLYQHLDFVVQLGALIVIMEIV